MTVAAAVDGIGLKIGRLRCCQWGLGGSDSPPLGVAKRGFPSPVTHCQKRSSPMSSFATTRSRERTHSKAAPVGCDSAGRRAAAHVIRLHTVSQWRGMKCTAFWLAAGCWAENVSGWYHRSSGRGTGGSRRKRSA